MNGKQLFLNYGSSMNPKCSFSILLVMRRAFPAGLLTQTYIEHLSHKAKLCREDSLCVGFQRGNNLSLG